MMPFKQRVKFWRRLSKEAYPKELQEAIEDLIPRIQKFRDSRDWLIHGIPTKNSTSQRVQFYRNRHLYHTPESIEKKLAEAKAGEMPDMLNRIEDKWFTADEFLNLPDLGQTLLNDFNKFIRESHLPTLGIAGAGYAWIQNPGEDIKHLNATIVSASNPSN